MDQAVALAGPATTLIFICVREARGAGATRRATISAERAEAALAHAVKTARQAGLDAGAELLPGHDPRPVLLDEASRADLLVVATHSGSRAGGILLGGTSAAALHRSTVPVLIARENPGKPFPERILVATDGSPDAHRAVELAARIAHRHRSKTFLVSVDPVSHGDAKKIAVDAVDLTADLGVEPTVIRPSGHADERILEAAAAQETSLILLGSRGLSGVRALGSVSERVAHRAHCSVLVARPA